MADDPSPVDATTSRRSFRLLLEYDGRDFEGWQLQAGDRPARTVQGVLEAAFASIGCPAFRLQAAGRTDAEGQTASVELARALAPRSLVRALNARLPDDVVVRAVVEVAPGWNAADAATAKLYRYRIWNGAERSPLRLARFAWIPEALDAERMRAAAAVFVGTHDFSALRASGSSAKTSVRTVRSVAVEGEGRGEIAIDVVGEGFLRHMVRNLAGTLIEVGRGRFPVEEVAAILASRDRGRAGPTAPAHGLTLVRVWDTVDRVDSDRTEGANGAHGTDETNGSTGPNGSDPVGPGRSDE
jgi:tRNA pseudouridine38-40 synthase